MSIVNEQPNKKKRNSADSDQALPSAKKVKYSFMANKKITRHVAMDRGKEIEMMIRGSRWIQCELEHIEIIYAPQVECYVLTTINDTMMKCVVHDNVSHKNGVLFLHAKDDGCLWGTCPSDDGHKKWATRRMENLEVNDLEVTIAELRGKQRAAALNNEEESKVLPSWVEDKFIHFNEFTAATLCDYELFDLSCAKGLEFALLKKDGDNSCSPPPVIVSAPTGNGKTTWIQQVLQKRCPAGTVSIFVVHAQHLASKVASDLKEHMGVEEGDGSNIVVIDYKKEADLTLMDKISRSRDRVILVIHSFSLKGFKCILDEMPIDLVVIDEVEEVRKQLFGWNCNGDAQLKSMLDHGLAWLQWVVKMSSHTIAMSADCKIQTAEFVKYLKYEDDEDDSKQKLLKQKKKQAQINNYRLSYHSDDPKYASSFMLNRGHTYMDIKHHQQTGQSHRLLSSTSGSSLIVPPPSTSTVSPAPPPPAVLPRVDVYMNTYRTCRLTSSITTVRDRWIAEVWAEVNRDDDEEVRVAVLLPTKKAAELMDMWIDRKCSMPNQSKHIEVISITSATAHNLKHDHSIEHLLKSIGHQMLCFTSQIPAGISIVEPKYSKVFVWAGVGGPGSEAMYQITRRFRGDQNLFIFLDPTMRGNMLSAVELLHKTHPEALRKSIVQNDDGKLETQMKLIKTVPNQQRLELARINSQEREPGVFVLNYLSSLRRSCRVLTIRDIDQEEEGKEMDKLIPPWNPPGMEKFNHWKHHICFMTPAEVRKKIWREYHDPIKCPFQASSIRASEITSIVPGHLVLPLYQGTYGRLTLDAIYQLSTKVNHRRLSVIRDVVRNIDKNPHYHLDQLFDARESVIRGDDGNRMSPQELLESNTSPDTKVKVPFGLLEGFVLEQVFQICKVAVTADGRVILRPLLQSMHAGIQFIDQHKGQKLRLPPLALLEKIPENNYRKPADRNMEMAEAQQRLEGGEEGAVDVAEWKKLTEGLLRRAVGCGISDLKDGTLEMYFGNNENLKHARTDNKMCGLLLGKYIEWILLTGGTVPVQEDTADGICDSCPAEITQACIAQSGFKGCSRTHELMSGEERNHMEPFPRARHRDIRQPHDILGCKEDHLQKLGVIQQDPYQLDRIVVMSEHKAWNDARNGGDEEETKDSGIVVLPDEEQDKIPSDDVEAAKWLLGMETEGKMIIGSEMDKIWVKRSRYAINLIRRMEQAIDLPQKKLAHHIGLSLQMTIVRRIIKKYLNKHNFTIIQKRCTIEQDGEEEEGQGQKKRVRFWTITRIAQDA